MPYLQNLYQSWRQNPKSLFGNIPINEEGLGGFSTLCPPIPWLGSHSNKIIIISLEPKLSNESFQYQIKSTDNFDKWKEFYLTEQYFSNLYADQPWANPTYWKRLASFINGYCNIAPQNLQNFTTYLNNNWIKCLSSTVCELPFAQYHATGHPRYIPSDEQLKDFQLRLEIIKKVNDNQQKKQADDLGENIVSSSLQNKVELTIIVYGVSKWNFIRKYFDHGKEFSETNGARIYDSKSFNKIIVLPQNSKNRNYSYSELFDMGHNLRQEEAPIK